MTIDTKRRVARLRELAKKLTGDERTVMRELALEVPPNEDRDVDYLLDWAADEIDRLRERITKAEEAMMFSSCGFCRDATRHLQGLCVPELED